MRNFIAVVALVTCCGHALAELSRDLELRILEEYNENAPMENANLLEGDILPGNELRRFYGTSADSRRWPRAIVPYVVDSTLSSRTDLIREAMAHIEARTRCIRFVPRSSERDYIRVAARTGCSSNVGRQGGEQTVSIGKGCDRFGTIVHELTHAVGFEHEHTRPDRDSYIRIYPENIEPKFQSQFKVKPPPQRLVDQFSYDSIMLYGSKAFSRKAGKPSMLKLNGEPLAEVHHKNGLSGSDVERIRNFYGC